MTEKLYDRNAYLTTFFATVLSCEAAGDRFAVALDKTAFFPEEGGQTADVGTLGGVPVLDAKLRDGVIVHDLPAPLAVGETVEGKIDFSGRYEKMQCHTGEHIVSGLLHSLYGIENVGFHLGSFDVTLDTSAPVDEKILSHIEELANRAIYDDLAVDARYPSPDELSAMTYRSKISLTEGVRIVTIPGIDVCACCAPHVAHTGEIGILKFIGFEKHKSGTRVHLLAGKRALRYFGDLLSAAGRVSESLSSPILEIGAAVSDLLSERDGLLGKLAAAERALALDKAAGVSETEGDLAVYLDDLPTDALRAFANAASPKVSGALCAFAGKAGNLRYVMMTQSGDVMPAVRAANAALSGKGGGRGNMAQGSFSCDPDAVLAFFAK